MSAPELKPCPNPFCKKSRGLQIVWDLYRRRIHCIDCGIKGPSSAGKISATVSEPFLDAQAAYAWNTRADLCAKSEAISPTQDERVRALEAENARLRGALDGLRLSRSELSHDDLDNLWVDPRN